MVWLPFTVSEFRDLDFWSWRIGSYSATGHTLIRTTNTSSTLCFDMPWWAAAYLALCWLALIRIEKNCFQALILFYQRIFSLNRVSILLAQ